MMQAIKSQLFIASLCLTISQIGIYRDAHAVSIGLSDVPLYVMEAVEPNIILSMDDSGSMYWSFMPDGIYGNVNTNRAKSSRYNKIYYDPNITYTPAVDKDGISLGNASFTAAWNDGFNQTGTGSCTVNLSTSYRPTWYYGDHCDSTNNTNEYAGSAEPAYYYVFDATLADGNENNDANYRKVVVGAAEQQNFANWYSYYRKRSYIAKTAATRTFSTLGSGLRMMRQTINTQNLTQPEKFTGSARSNFFTWLSNIDATGGTPLRSALDNAGNTLSSSDDPYRDDPTDSTSAARSCRQNFHIMMTDGYWSNGDSGIGSNQDNSSHDIEDNDYDVTSYDPTNALSSIYSDTNNDYLADTSFYYWITDLRGLTNNVPPSITNIIYDPNSDPDNPDVDNDSTFWHPNNDPANWQHMVTYTIGFGLDGALDYPDDFADLLSGTSAWSADKIDDLWHTAINGRGLYLSAKNPDDLVASFTTILNNVLNRTSTAAPVSLNSGSVSSETKLFQVKFDTSDWTGLLFSLPISDGSMNSTCTSTDEIGAVCAPEWEASCKLDGGVCEATGTTEVALNWNTGRTILTLNPDSLDGIAFRWDELYNDATATDDQQDLLNGTDGRGSDRLNYIRGDKSKETSNYNATSCSDCNFRNRNSLLGDLINSNPLYVGSPSRVYPDSLEDSSHYSFRTTHSNRQGMIYVGGNDGMLHGFNSSTGTEELAYVPNEVFPNLPQLTEQNYTHTNYVDGQLSEADVYFSDDWHTVIAGGLGYGGQGIFALDVTDPTTFSETNADNIVMWEYSDSDDNDLGYTYGEPIIRKLNSGEWAVIFGNGYDSTTPDGAASTTGDAAIYIVNIADGSIIEKISTEVGIDEDPTGDGRPNGITGVYPVDVDFNFTVDYLYAGDLFGNIWRINLTGNSNTWGIALDAPLYTATDDNGVAQPITTIPAIGFHQTQVGRMVYFGTGKYLGVGDVTDTSQQTFYAVWDRWFDGDADTVNDESDFSTFTRSNLLEQEVMGVNTTQFTDKDARVTTNYQIDWSSHLGWYLDLTEAGERVFQSPFLRNDRVIFVTVTPSEDPCLSGGSSWLMELDAHSGSRLDISPFDYSGDGAITIDDDQVEFDVDGDGDIEEVAGSGIRIDDGGIYTIPAVLKLPERSNERKFMATSLGVVEEIDESGGRRLKQSWRAIKECGI